MHYEIRIWKIKALTPERQAELDRTERTHRIIVIVWGKANSPFNVVEEINSLKGCRKIAWKTANAVAIGNEAFHLNILIELVDETWEGK